MSSRRPLYLALSVVVLVALVASAMLVFSYRPSDGSVVAVVPTPTAELPSIGGDASIGPGESPVQVTTEPAPTSTDGSLVTPSPGSALVKDAQVGSKDPAQLTGYSWPIRNSLITGREGPRDFGAFVIVDGQGVHDGLDIATFCGDKVRAAHDGTVLYAGRNFDPYIGYWGDPTPIYARLQRLGRVNEQPIVVVVDDGNGYRSMYVHLQEALAEPGTAVKAGDVIGLEGMTGYATGCHLHYTMIRMDGVWYATVPRLAQFGYPPLVRERIDPLKVLPWGDQYAPQKLKDRIYGTPSPGIESPAPSTLAPSTVTPSPAPSGAPIQ
jgi:murein DD-endopeptidase MepM/ murein hydrolase activator NlpD